MKYKLESSSYKLVKKTQQVLVVATLLTTRKFRSTLSVCLNVCMTVCLYVRMFVHHFCYINWPHGGVGVWASSQHYLIHVSVDCALSCEADMSVLGCSHLERNRGSAAQRHAGINVRISTQREDAICSEQREGLTRWRSKGLHCCSAASWRQSDDDYYQIKNQSNKVY